MKNIEQKLKQLKYLIPLVFVAPIVVLVALMAWWKMFYWILTLANGCKMYCGGSEMLAFIFVMGAIGIAGMGIITMLKQ